MMIEEMPMAPQQGQQQQPQQEAQQPEQQGSFPSGYGEAKQFSNDILQVLYDDKTHDNVMKQIASAGDDKAQAVGMITSNIVGDRAGDVRAQSGRPVEMKLIIGAVEAVIGEIAEMAENSGAFEMADEEKQGAMKVAISILDDMGGGKNGS